MYRVIDEWELRSVETKEWKLANLLLKFREFTNADKLGPKLWIRLTKTAGGPFTINDAISMLESTLALSGSSDRARLPFDDPFAEDDDPRVEDEDPFVGDDDPLTEEEDPPAEEDNSPAGDDGLLVEGLSNGDAGDSSRNGQLSQPADTQASLRQAARKRLPPAGSLMASLDTQSSLKAAKTRTVESFESPLSPVSALTTMEPSTPTGIVHPDPPPVSKLPRVVNGRGHLSRHCKGKGIAK